MSGELKKGTILSENQLSAEFGMSRSPIREALRILSNEGLIDLQ
jgi:GntR family transcriptional regulator of gluconate operon